MQRCFGTPGSNSDDGLCGGIRPGADRWALGKPGTEIQAPMAIVICGLQTSTALNMIVVPAPYYRFHRNA
jgi:hypothetical protein